MVGVCVTISNIPMSSTDSTGGYGVLLIVTVLLLNGYFIFHMLNTMIIFQPGGGGVGVRMFIGVGWLLKFAMRYSPFN